MKQTAVQWLFDEFIKAENKGSLPSLFLKAIEMEKEQIQDAYWNGGVNWDEGIDALTYYNETYGDK
jgi:hypothetical protein